MRRRPALLAVLGALALLPGRAAAVETPKTLAETAATSNPPVSVLVPAEPPAPAPEPLLPWRSRPPEDPAWAPPAPPCLDRDSELDLAMPWGEPGFEALRAGYLSSDGKRWLASMMERARPYLPYVMERIRFYGLPEELAWLPVIESGWSPRALSKSGALGLWQFMKNSIGGYGMRIDDWVDERRDFMKSTDAALRKLADNRAVLGDWNLALAAYNMGLGAVTRAVAASGLRDFFELRAKGFLSRETSAYVPSFLAVASILRHPGRYGLPVAWDAPMEWEAVELRRSVDLALLAKATGLPYERLRDANAELRYSVTPPWKGYSLKVPTGRAEAVTAALDDPSLRLLRFTLHTVRSGDSLSALARAYGSPLEVIAEANPGLKPSLIKVGQVIVVPLLKEGAAPPPPEIADETVAFDAKCVVAKGDSLWGLALRYKVRPETLAEKNGLELTSVLREGMSLAVPTIKE